jgi:hypothetical protein
MLSNTKNTELEGKTSLLERWSVPGKALANMTACEVLELAESGDVIIRGWGSAQLMKTVDHVLCVRVCAPLHLRTKTLMARLETTDEDYARNEIIINDTAHDRLLKRMVHGDWQSTAHYDLVINTERVPVDEGVDLIEHTLQLPSFKESEQSQSHLTKLRIEAQLRTTMLSDTSMKADAAVINFDVEEHSHRVTLSGGVRQRKTGDQMIAKAREIIGVSRVIDNISVIKD